MAWNTGHWNRTWADVLSAPHCYLFGGLLRRESDRVIPVVLGRVLVLRLGYSCASLLGSWWREGWGTWGETFCSSQ